MKPQALTEVALLALEAGQKQIAQRLLNQALFLAPGDLLAGLSLVRLEMENQNPAAAVRVLADLWRETRDSKVGDILAEVSLALAQSADHGAFEDRKVIERLAGMLKALHGANGILIDTLEYDIIGGLAEDARKLIPIYKAGLTARTGKPVVFFSGKAANPALVEMISRVLPTFVDYNFPGLMSYSTYDWTQGRYSLNQQFSRDFFGRHVDLFKNLVEFTHSTSGRAYCESREEENGFLANVTPQINFNQEEAGMGEAFLRNKLCLPEGAWFVCVYARDAAYYGETPQSPNWFRNSDIQTFLPAIDEILAHGGYVVRVGERTSQVLHHPDPRFLDYSNSPFREPLLDVYLLAKCRFLLGTPSGLCHVANIFGTPELMVNSVNICNISSAALYIPKKIRDVRTGRILPFSAFMDRFFSANDVGAFCENGINQEKLLKVYYEDNTPDEIAAAAREMMDRLDGAHTESPEVAAARERFAQAWKRWGSTMYKPPIATFFIEAYPELFA